MGIDTKLILDNEPLELARAAEWLDGLLGPAETPARTVAALQVALEEVLNNILCYAYADLDPHQIEVRLTTNEAAATLEFFDDGIPFDPSQPPAPPPVTAEDPELGGLGLLFLQHLMDEVVFERLDNRNHLTIRKFLAPQHVNGERGDGDQRVT